MCTVVFIPGKEGYYFASLRDEDPGRQRALAPTMRSDDDTMYLSPLDPAGNGTWIGVNEYGNIIILLNGGFYDHIKQEGYARSRGAVVRELLLDEMPVIAWLLMDMNNIEPYTLIVWAGEKLFQLVWDGQKKYRICLSNTIPHIFSSATLYDETCAIKRKESFNGWIERDPTVTALSLGNFFTTAIPDTQNGFIINRAEKFKTLSYSFIEMKNEGTAEFQYHDLSTADAVISMNSLHVSKRACSCALKY